MDYGRLIRDAWSMTRRHRFLWVLGLFTGTSAGTCSFSPSFQWQTGRGDFDGELPADVAGAFDALGGWITENIALIVTALALLLLLGLVFLIISVIAQGGMARATADIARARPTSHGVAWRAGLHLFWRYLGLWVLLLAAVVALTLVIAVVVLMGIVVYSAVGQSGRTALIVLGVILAFFAVLAWIPIAILVNIIIAYAQRAIAIEDVGPIAALQAAAQLLRARLGDSLLVWLFSLALGIGSGIATAVAMLILLVPLVLSGIIFYLAAGFSAPTIIYIVAAVLALIAAAWALSAISNTYFWSYWTLAYLRLTGQSEQQAQGETQ